MIFIILKDKRVFIYFKLIMYLVPLIIISYYALNKLHLYANVIKRKQVRN